MGSLPYAWSRAPGGGGRLRPSHVAQSSTCLVARPTKSGLDSVGRPAWACPWHRRQEVRDEAMNRTKRRLSVARGGIPHRDAGAASTVRSHQVRHTERRFAPVLGAWTVASVLALGCGGAGQKSNAKTAEGDPLPVVFQHEPCDLGSREVEKVDVRADGKPGMVRVLSGGREVCRMLDFNHDGAPDTFVYLDDQGRIRRRESDFDRDGKVDEVDTYAGGTIVRKDRATTLDGRFHTWDFYEGGRLQRRLRDSDSDGKVDQWWSWPAPDKIECAVIRTDNNADGRPDDSTAVDQCAPSGASTGAPLASAPATPPPAASSSAGGGAGAAPATASSGATATPASAPAASAAKATTKPASAAKGGQP